MPKKKVAAKKSVEKNNTPLAGEYFVAAELYRRGFSIGMTIGNAKAIDLFANKGSRTLSIQVKAIKSKSSSGWPIMKAEVIDDIFYIFVNLNGKEKPDYFIATGQEAREKVKQYEKRGVIQLATLKNDTFYNCWEKLE